ncbi:MAG: pitrilysin family protein [Rikenellaceae bacterium]
MLPEIKKIDNISVLHPALSASKGGVKFYTIVAPAQDVVRISLVFCAGVKYQTKSFVASATANLLTEGCGNYTSHEVAQMLDFYGIYYDVTVDRDYCVITICTLGRFTENAISLLKDVILRPRFLQSELDVYASKRKAALTIEREKMKVRSREAFVKSIFGEKHDYAIFSNATDYDNLTVDDLKQFYNKFYNRNNLFVVLSGNIGAEVIEDVARLVDSLPKWEDMRRVTENPTAKGEVIRVENSESVQSSINIGRVLFSRNHPDFIPMQVLATVLGGYFSSRLMQNLREENGYTYGVHAAAVNMQDSGYFIISSELEKETTDKAIEQIFTEIEILKNELIGTEELDMVKRVIIGEVIRILDGPFGIADVTIENIQNEVTNSATEQMISEIGNITAEKLQQVAQKYLNREDLSVVIYS